MSVVGILGKKIGMTQVFDDRGDIHPVTVLRLAPASSLSSRPWRRTAMMPPDRLRRLRQGLEGQQGDDWPLRQVECAPGQDDQGSCHRDRQARPKAKRQSPSRLAIVFWSTSSTTKSSSTSSAPPRAAALLALFVAMVSAAVPSRTVTCSRCRVRSAPRRFRRAYSPGQRMPGHMGHAQITVRNLRIRGIDLDDNLLLVEGAVPGPRDGYVLISKAKAPPRERRGFAGAATKDALKASKKAAPKKKK